MKFKDVLDELFKLPTTLDEAIAYVKKNPMLNTTVEEIAFKQTVINILIAAGLVTENDFNASVEYFKQRLYEDFGKELLRESQLMAEKEKEENKDDEWDDWPDDGSHLPQA